jgi:hypothetical protein
VEGKYSDNCGETSDLSGPLAFESHPCVATEPKIESSKRLQASLRDFSRIDARSSGIFAYPGVRHGLFRKTGGSGEQNESEASGAAFARAFSASI